MKTNEPLEPEVPDVPETGASHELAERLARYRARLVAEGRMNAVRMFDRAVAQPVPNNRMSEGEGQ